MEDKIKLAIRKAIAMAHHATYLWLRQLRGRVIILTYHRVLTERELNQKCFIQPGVFVKVRTFEEQIRFLKTHFQIISFSELLSCWAQGHWDKTARYCVITFDDGWLDNYTYAYPILRKYDIPATIFLPTTLIGTYEWLWPDRLGYLLQYLFREKSAQDQKGKLELRKHNHSAVFQVICRASTSEMNGTIERCKAFPTDAINEALNELFYVFNLQLPKERIFLNWDEVKEMSMQNISFGSHSLTHQILTKLSFKEVQSEVTDSLNSLKGRGINHLPVFCYPNGSYNQGIADQVKASGYQAAVSADFGLEGATPAELFSLKRVGVHNDISATLPLFTFHISGLNHLINRVLHQSLIHSLMGAL